MRTPRPPGRPRLDPESDSVNIHFRLGSKDYDQTLQRAQQQRESLADYIRRCVLGEKTRDE